MPEHNKELLSLSAMVVASYVQHNSLRQADLAALIANTHRALSGLAKKPDPAPQTVAKPTPAVPIKKSVTPDFVICLEDGRKFKSLRRHLRTSYDMSLDDYRTKWGLPADYPMVAPNYAESRSALAKSMGLGHLRKKTSPSAADAPTKVRRRKTA